MVFAFVIPNPSLLDRKYFFRRVAGFECVDKNFGWKSLFQLFDKLFVHDMSPSAFFECLVHFAQEVCTKRFSIRVSEQDFLKKRQKVDMFY